LIVGVKGEEKQAVTGLMGYRREGECWAAENTQRRGATWADYGGWRMV